MGQRTQKLVEALCDGVAAHLTLLARCGLWPAYSEYLLYDPIVRIAAHLQWKVSCEYALPKKKTGAGDNPRLDFFFSDDVRKLDVAVEVKWPRDTNKSCSVKKDVAKLRSVRATKGHKIDGRLLLVAGYHVVKDDSPLLTCKLIGLSVGPRCARALGYPGRAWGASVYDVAK